MPTTARFPDRKANEEEKNWFCPVVAEPWPPRPQLPVPNSRSLRVSTTHSITQTGCFALIQKAVSACYYAVNKMAPKAGLGPFALPVPAFSSMILHASVCFPFRFHFFGQLGVGRPRQRVARLTIQAPSVRGDPGDEVLKNPIGICVPIP